MTACISRHTGVDINSPPALLLTMLCHRRRHRRRRRCAHSHMIGAQDTYNHASANTLQILPPVPPNTPAGTYIIPKYETQQEALDFLKTLPVNPAPEVFGLSFFSKVASPILLPDFEA
jgi:hypothetical protein